MKKILFLLLVPGIAAASSFSGFFVGGGLGWDFSRVATREQSFFSSEGRIARFPTIYSDGFRGMGYVGWNGCFGAPHMGVRLGYQGFVDDVSINQPVVFPQLLWKEQGAFLDLLPGWQFHPCLYFHLILGAGLTKVHLETGPSRSVLVRDADQWSYLPRLGAALQWAFWRSFVVGFEWNYTFPGRFIFGAPSQGPGGTDFTRRHLSVSSNQIALTLSWYFCR